MSEHECDPFCRPMCAAWERGRQRGGVALVVRLLGWLIPLAAAYNKGRADQVAVERAKATTRWCDET